MIWWSCHINRSGPVFWTQCIFTAHAQNHYLLLSVENVTFPTDSATVNYKYSRFRRTYWNVKLFGSVHWHQKWLGLNLDLWPNVALRICNFLARRTHSFSNVFFLGGVSQLQLALSWIGHICHIGLHNGPKATFILQCNFKTYRRGRAVDM